MAAPLTIDQDLATPSLDGVEIPSHAQTDRARRKSRIAAAAHGAYALWLVFLFIAGSLGLSVLPEPTLTFVDIAFGIAVFVAFMVWVYEAYRIAGMLSRYPMDSTPGWAVGVYIIPIANLWLPFKRMQEVDAASSESAEVTYDPRGRNAALLGVWWAFWVASAVLVQVYTRFMPENAWLGLAGGVATLVSSVLSALVAIRLHDAQEAQADRLAAAAEETPEASGARLF